MEKKNFMRTWQKHIRTEKLNLSPRQTEKVKNK